MTQLDQLLTLSPEEGLKLLFKIRAKIGEKELIHQLNSWSGKDIKNPKFDVIRKIYTYSISLTPTDYDALKFEALYQALLEEHTLE